MFTARFNYHSFIACLMASLTIWAFACWYCGWETIAIIAALMGAAIYCIPLPPKDLVNGVPTLSRLKQLLDAELVKLCTNGNTNAIEVVPGDLGPAARELAWKLTEQDLDDMEVLLTFAQPEAAHEFLTLPNKYTFLQGVMSAIDFTDNKSGFITLESAHLALASMVIE